MEIDVGRDRYKDRGRDRYKDRDRDVEIEVVIKIETER